MGRRPVIIRRGYKSKGEPTYRTFQRWLAHALDQAPTIARDGKTRLLDSEDAGDEPYRLAENLQGVLVVVDTDPAKVGPYAIQRLGADIVI
jgi:tetraacyldisaccharide 4'-kinase